MPYGSRRDTISYYRYTDLRTNNGRHEYFAMVNILIINRYEVRIHKLDYHMNISGKLLTTSRSYYQHDVF